MAELLHAGSIPRSVITVNLAGEPLSPSLVDKLYQHPSIRKVYDLYGPTESTTYSTFTLREPGGRATIGRPIANTRVHILDQSLQPVPIGIRGELHIGGAGLARGYLHRKQLTGEKFITDPFNCNSGTLLYKTGDLARYLPDGNIEFLGREDHQVKIRGFRIELGEIEAVISQHPSVKSNAVVAREGTPGDKRLVAYVTAQNGTISSADLRAFLGQKLPNYMIPELFLFLKKLPMTPNGKVDRKALPVPEQEGLGSKPGYVGSRTPVEEALAGIWCDVLRLKQVGVYDNFFELGGHSLLATRVVSRMRSTFQVEIALRALLERPTIAGLATVVNQRRLEELRSGQPGQILAEIENMTEQEAGIVVGAQVADARASAHRLHLSPPQSPRDRPFLFYLHFPSSAQRLANHLGPTWPLYAIAAPFDEELRLWHEQHRLAITMEELAARCVTTIRRVQPKGPYRLGGGCFGGVLAFEVASQLKRLGEDVAFLALIDAFYIPGCRRLSIPAVRRWAYHGRRTLSEGFKSPATKLRKQRELAKRRRSQLEGMRARDRRSGEMKSESILLPQAEFLGQILEPYKAKPYSGNAVLIRSVGDPFFTFDPGPSNGWGAVIQGDLQAEDLNCGHADISEEPHISKVAKWLEKHLSAMEAKPRDQTRALNAARANDAARAP